MIGGLTNAGELPVLERLIQFSGQRHRLIAHNIANIDTPDFRPVDVSVGEFQASLKAAIGERGTGATTGLRPESGRTIEFTDDGVELRPIPRADNILYHDRNDRDPERLMQSMVENFMTFRAAADLFKARLAVINDAIRERI